jgi:hypothetical protein
MHPTGFEPALSLSERDYESSAFNHSATDARKEDLESVGFEPTSIISTTMSNPNNPKNQLVEIFTN